MRLVSSALAVLVLAAALAAPLVAQGRLPSSLPWETVPAVPWRAGLGSHGGIKAGEEGDDPILSRVASKGPLSVNLWADGTLHVVGTKKVRRLRLGLPGRPLKAWRDAGIPLDLTSLESGNDPWRFPSETPLAKGIQTLPWGGEDFRTALSGLLWILDDGEHFITVVHPATARVEFLPLPIGQDFSLRMTPGYLEVVETPGKNSTSAPRRWFLPWLVLMPQFARLARPEEIVAPGTALVPFPKE